MSQIIVNLIASSTEEYLLVKAAVTALLSLETPPTPELALCGSEPCFLFRVKKYDPQFWQTALRLVKRGFPLHQLTEEVVRCLHGGFDAPKSLHEFADLVGPLPVAPMSEQLKLPAVEAAPVSVGGNGSRPAAQARKNRRERKEEAAAAEANVTPAVRRIKHSCGHEQTHRLRDLDRLDKAAVRAEVDRLKGMACKECLLGVPVG